MHLFVDTTSSNAQNITLKEDVTLDMEFVLYAIDYKSTVANDDDKRTYTNVTHPESGEPFVLTFDGVVGSSWSRFNLCWIDL